MMDLVSIAVAVTTTLTPFMPYLLDAGKAAVTNVAETIGARGGEAARQTAQSLWARITNHLPEDADVTDAANALATRPESSLYRTNMAEVLTLRLQSNPALAQELLVLLGGQVAIQQIVAGQDAQMRNIRQKMTGAGAQIIRGGDGSVLDDVSQELG